MTVMRGTSVPRDQEMLMRLQACERLLGVTGQNNGPGQPNVQEITGHHRTRDASGLLRVQLGALQTGDFGLGVTDPTGVYNEVWPTTSAFGLETLETTSSNVPVALTGSPSLACYIGVSGDAIVDASAYIQTNAATTGGQVWLFVDGSTFYALPIPMAQLGGPTSGVNGFSGSRRRLSAWAGAAQPLAPNQEHTFSLEYSSTSGSVSFQYASISVLPL